MNLTSPHLKALEEIERSSIPSLLEVILRRASTPLLASGGTLQAGTGTTILQTSVTGPRRSKSVSVGRWR
jgi:hypothetical protein